MFSTDISAKIDSYFNFLSHHFDLTSLDIYQVEKNALSLCYTSGKEPSAFSADTDNGFDDMADKQLLGHFKHLAHKLFIHHQSDGGRLLVAINLDNELDTSGVCSMLSEFVGQYLQAIHLDEKLQSSRDRNRFILSEISALHEISRAFEGVGHIDPLLTYIVDKARLLLNTESASLMLYLSESDELEFKVVLGPKSQKVKSFRLPMGKGIAGWVAQNREAILIPDAYDDPRFDPSFDKRSGYRTRSILCVPMIHQKNMIGVVTLLNRNDSRPFNEDDKNTLTTFAGQAALAIENSRMLQTVLEKERIDKELQVASQIQQRLIPQSLPKINRLDMAATYLPCKEMSGDFYDVIPLENERFAFVVADVAGKGIPAALLVSTMQARLTTYLESSQDLQTIIGRLNDSLIKTTTDDRYITFYIAVYDPATQQLHSLNAGHNPPLLFHRKEIIHLRTGGIFVGSLPWEYESEKRGLMAGDVLALFTDGLIEAMDADEEEFGEERVIEVVKENIHFSAKEIMEKVKDAVNIHCAGEALQDDFTLLIVKIF